MDLPPDVRASYTKIIDTILAASDLTTISEKRIRKGLQDAVGYDITPQKAAIKELIMERFDIFADPNGAVEGVSQPAATPVVNGHSTSPDTSAPPVAPISPSLSASPQKRSADAESPSEPDEKTPPKKKRKSESVDADAAYAAKLQAEENLRARPTRGASSRKAAPPKKKKATPKSKTSKKVKAEDDSDLEGSGSETTKKEVTRTGGFHKPLTLSPALSALLNGEVSLSRPQTVKKMWEYIRENDLQDPADRRQIRCDEPMRAVFKQDRVHMFTMTKILNQNLYTPDE